LENARLLKEFQKQKDNQDNELKEISEAEHKIKVEKFLKAEGKLVTSSLSSPPSSSSTSSSTASASSSVRSSKSNDSDATSSTASVSNMQGDLSKKLPSFWVPSLVPESKTKEKLKKPVTTIYCPMSNKPISMKDLVEVKFKFLEDKDDKRALIAKRDRYVCALTNDVLNNYVPCCVLRTS
jgi:nitric oxide synthase-interacting protein